MFRMPAAAVLVLSLAACTFSGEEGSTYLADQRYAPKPADAPIEIIPGEPDRPYILLGDVNAWADVPLFGNPDPQNAVEKLKVMAREMGGDAIIRYTGHRAPAGTVGAGGFTAQGMAVRWK